MISNNELISIKGGTAKYLLIGGIGSAIISFVIGIFDGYFNPISCNACKLANSK